MAANTVKCPYCGTENLNTYTDCADPACGRKRPQRPVPAPDPFTPGPLVVRPPGAEKKMPAGICGILLGALGVHKFILGYTMEGVIMLVLSLISVGTLALVMAIIGLIEGIIYLTKTDDEFVNTYIKKKKGWF